jgi:hypothetical protein
MSTSSTRRRAAVATAAATNAEARIVAAEAAAKQPRRLKWQSSRSRLQQQLPWPCARRTPTIRMVHDHGALTVATVSRHHQCDVVADITTAAHHPSSSASSRSLVMADTHQDELQRPESVDESKDASTTALGCCRVRRHRVP